MECSMQALCLNISWEIQSQRFALTEVWQGLRQSTPINSHPNVQKTVQIYTSVTSLQQPQQC